MAGEVERLSGKLGIDTTDFKASIAAANRELRVLESGFKAGAAALGDWTKDATGLENRAKSLTSQIEIQALKVEALAAEHKRLAEENGENSRAAQDAEIKLNKETETLNKMQVELSGTEEELQNVSEGEEETGAAAEDSSEKMETFKTAMKGVAVAAGVLVGAVAAVGAAAIAAVGGIAALVLKAADAAGEIQDLSDKTGISTEKLQEYGFIADQTGTSLETITGAQSRLIRSMNSASGAVDDYNQKLSDAQEAGKDMEEVQDDLDKHLDPTLEAFNKLGISVRDSSGHLRDNQAVFAEVIDQLGRIQNPAERDALAMQIFGKSAQELNPLVKLGSSGMAEMTKKAHELGAVMSSEDVAALDDFGDMLAGLQDGLKGTLGTLAADFLPAFQQVFGPNGAGKYLKEFSDLIRGANGDFGKVAEGITRLITEIATDIADQAPKFLQSGLDIIKSILTAITAALPSILPAAVEILTSLINFIIGALPLLIEAGVPLLLTIVQSIIENLPLLIDAALQAVIALATGLADALPELIPAVVQAVITIVQTLTENIPLLIDAALQLILGLVQGIIIALPVLIAALPQIITAIIDALVSALPQIFEAAGQLISMLAAGIVAAIPVLILAISELIVRLGDSLAKFIQTLPEIGKKFIMGLVDGIKNASGFLYDAVKQLILNMIATIENLLGIQSPSKVGRRIGQNVFTSMGLGGLDVMADMERTFAAITNRLAGAAAGGSSGNSYQNSSQTDNFSFYAPIIMQGDTPAGSLGARLKGRRY
jgi:phage-related protein